jgi:hypothetical protein
MTEVGDVSPNSRKLRRGPEGVSRRIILGTDGRYVTVGCHTPRRPCSPRHTAIAADAWHRREGRQRRGDDWRVVDRYISVA